MPVVQIDMLAGRTTEQRRQLVKKVTEALVETIHCPANAVTVIIRDMDKEHLGVGGKLSAD